MEGNKVKKGLLKPKKDRRDFSRHKKFGSPALPALPTEGLKRPRPSLIRNQGSTNLCTGYTATGMGAVKYGRQFSPDWFCMQENKAQGGVWGGSSLRTQAKIYTGKGLLPLELAQMTWQKDGEFNSVNPLNWDQGLEEKAKPFKARSFFTADGPYDTFDNIRVALFTNDKDGEGASVGIDWHFEWNGAKDGVLFLPKDIFSTGHNIRIYDWTLIDGVPYLVFENYEDSTWGDKGIGYIPREVANLCIYTSEGPYVYTDNDPKDVKKELWGILEHLKTLLISISDWISKGAPKVEPVAIDEVLPPPAPPVTKPKPTPLTDFCEAIKTHEGWYVGSRSERNHSPGNLKYTAYTVSLGAINADNDGYAMFPSYEIGWNALKQLVIDASENKLKLCKNCTVASFIKGYAPPSENLTDKYIQRVCSISGLSRDTLLADIVKAENTTNT